MMFFPNLKFGIPNREQAAWEFVFLEYRYFVSPAVQLVGCCQSGRAAADHGYPLAVADGADRLDVSFAKSGLYDGGFVLAYRDRLVTAQFQHTAFLTESGADASGKLREVAGLLQHVEGFAPSAFIEQVLPFGLFVT